MQRKRLGDMLVDENILTEEELKTALALNKGERGLFGEVLIEHGFITEKQLIDVLQKQLGLEYIELMNLDLDPALAGYVSKAVAEEFRICPCRTEGNTLWLAMEDPQNYLALEETEHSSGMKVEPLIASKEGMDYAIKTLYAPGARAAAVRGPKAGVHPAKKGKQDDFFRNTISDEKFGDDISVNLLEQAVKLGAESILIQIVSEEIRMMMRIDGVLRRIPDLSEDMGREILAKLKTKAGMNPSDAISDDPVLKNGSFLLQAGGKNIRVRAFLLKTDQGENFLVHLANPTDAILTRSMLGIAREDEKKLDRILRADRGIILISGPAGSGKTMTYYSLLKSLADDSGLIISVEDPAETEIPGIVQVSADPEKGQSMAETVRQALLQEPDILAVDSLKDRETIETVLRASAGRMVIAVVESPDALGALDALRCMEISPLRLTSAVSAVLSQRLVRRICPDCRDDYVPDLEELQTLRFQTRAGDTFSRGRGCASCFGSGYRGRIGVFELLVMTDEFRGLLTGGESPQSLKMNLSSAGFVSIADRAMELAAKGVTTLDEVYRCGGETR